MSNNESAELTEPGIDAFDDPASFIAPELPAVLVLSLLVVFPARNDEVDASFCQSFAQRIGVVGAIGDHAIRLLPRTAFGTRYFDFGERDFCRRGTFEPNSQRKTATVDQYHPLRALATLGFTDCGAPVCNTHSLPSRQARLEAHGRPRLSLRRFGSASKGSINSHCASLNNSNRFLLMQEVQQTNRPRQKSPT
jgi:hypothetical protein